LAITGTSRLFAVASSPAFDLTIYGTGFTPSTRIGINGFFVAASRVTYVDPNRMRVSVLASDSANPGEIYLQVINTGAGSCSMSVATAIPVRAAGYALPTTADVVEFRSEERRVGK